jgi:signal peptidase I
MSDNIKRIIKEIIPFVCIVLLVLFVKQFIVTPVQVSGDSMYSTLKDGDIMILNKLGYKLAGLRRFQIVVVDNDDNLLIKRVIGLPGETIKYENNKLYVNGKEYKETFLSKDVVTNDFEVVVGDDCYFLMGDNRKVSLDSRQLGCFDIDKIEGTTSITLFPFTRFGGKN